jgi:gliding motility-associated protein GldE
LESLDIDPYSYGLSIILSSAFKPFTLEILISLAGIVVLLFCSALISGSEVAFFSITPSQLNDLKVKKLRKGDTIMKLLEMPRRLLATVLIANNFVNVAIVILSTYITKEIFNFNEFPLWAAFLIQVVVVTALILFTGEILPKIYATQKNIEFAKFMALPMILLVKISRPLSSILVNSTNLIDKKLKSKASDISMSELSDAIELTSDETTREEERKILKGIIKFTDLDVKEIMKARLDVIAVDMKTGFHDLLNIITESGFSRIPVYEESFDNIKGILYIKDLLSHLDKDDSFNWQKLVRDAFFVPENKRINDLLQEFQEKKIHMAVVVDEYGGTSGIVTLEDIIEEIVGEIDDEHDVSTDEEFYRRLDKNRYLFKAKTSLNDFCKIIGIEDKIFDEVKGESDTIAGLILEILGKIPGPGENVEYGQFTFTIKSVDKRRIKELIVKVDNPGDGKSDF